jgi:hypothetical protein
VVCITKSSASLSVSVVCVMVVHSDNLQHGHRTLEASRLRASKSDSVEEQAEQDGWLAYYKMLQRVLNVYLST